MNLSNFNNLDHFINNYKLDKFIGIIENIIVCFDTIQDFLKNYKDEINQNLKEVTKI